MRTDLTIQKDIISRLHDEPYVNAAAIGVGVRNGVAALSGEAASNEQRRTIEDVAFQTEGVRAITVDIQVGLPADRRRTDWELADAVARALEWHTAVRQHQIRISVTNGVITLAGQADFAFQRQAAVEAVRGLVGDVPVNDRITMKEPLTSAQADRLVKEALACHPSLDVSMIYVAVQDEKAVLTGVVYSAAEKAEVESAARTLPGIVMIDNRITLIKEQQTQKA
ncbi:MAG TPA: BON domain-containing protein [Puia sp.]|nr:BON domain-containing protein [Puia sp.]